MSASPGDPQPVFDLIVRHALHACAAFTARCLNSMANCCIAAPPSVETSQRSVNSMRCSGGHRHATTWSAARSSTGRPSISGTLTANQDCSGGTGNGRQDHLIDPTDARRHGDRHDFAERAVSRRLLRHPGRTLAHLRRAGGDRHRQRRNLSGVATAHRSAGATQQRIWRADRASIGDDRCAEGHVWIARRHAGGLRPDHQPSAPTVQWVVASCSSSMASCCMSVHRH